MHLIVGYSDLYNHKEVVEEIKEKWILDLLFALGFEDEDLDINNYDLNELLYDNNIEIIDFPDINSIQIKLDSEVVGELSSPSYSLLKDNDGLYFKIEVESWSDITNNEE